MIGGSWETVIGDYVLYQWIIILYTVSQELWIIQYHASNILVLCLESIRKIGRIKMVEKSVKDLKKS